MFSCLLLWSLLLNLYVYFVFFSEHHSSFRIADALILVYKPYYVTVFATAEAFEDALRWRHAHRCRLLVVEGATAEVVRPALAQVHRFAYHLHDVCSVKYLVYVSIRNSHVRYMYYSVSCL